MDAYQTILNPISTEKSMRLMESENKLVFAVDRRASKKDVKTALEEMFKAKVVKINTVITAGGKKRAFVRFSDETPAIDIATQLGIM
ncbi:MAG: 50S ribosomal protein L23 [Nanoarchaeota archaeon]